MTEQDIITKVALKHNVSSRVVEDLVDYMWHLVIRCFNDDRMPMIRLPGIGTFQVQPTKLKKLIKGMEKPGYRWKDKPDFEEYKVRIRKIYERRLREEYAGFPDRRVPPSIAGDVKNLRAQWTKK